MKDFSREHEARLRDMPPKTPIRMADEHDELGVIELFKMTHAEQPYHPLNVAKVAAHIRLAVQPGPQRRGIVGVIGERHDLKAAIFMLMDPIWYSDEWHLLEFFSYVRPDARRSTFASDLIAYAKQCATSIGIDLTVGVYSTIRTEAKIRLYRRWMMQVGAYFLYAPPNRQPVYDRIAALKIAAE